MNFKTFKNIPDWVYGLTGGLLLSYRFLTKYKNPKNINILDMCVIGFSGYIICGNIPILTPFIFVGVIYEDYNRFKKD